MLWRCKVLNGSNGWYSAEVVGDDFIKAFTQRFGTKTKFKDVEQFDEVRYEWVKIDRTAFLKEIKKENVL